MNISKTIKIWTIVLLGGMIAVSCDDHQPDLSPSYSIVLCSDNSHYDYWAGDCTGQVVLEQDYQVLDTLTECTATFGNNVNKTFVVKNFPVNCFSHLIKDHLQWHDFVSQSTDEVTLSFAYELLESRDINDVLHDEKHHHYTDISSKGENAIVVDMNGHRCKMVYKGQPILKSKDAEKFQYDGVSLELIYVIDTETNDTTEIRSSDTDVKLVIRPRGKDTYF